MLAYMLTFLPLYSTFDHWNCQNIWNWGHQMMFYSFHIWFAPFWSLCTISVCRKCIYEKLYDEETYLCPVCNIFSGALTFEKLRWISFYILLILDSSIFYNRNNDHLVLISLYFQVCTLLSWKHVFSDNYFF